MPESVARERLKKRSLAEGSADDSDEIEILKRMKTYYEKTFPLRWIYWGKENVPVITIDAQPPIEEVHQEILGKILTK